MRYELHQSILWNDLSISQTKLWRSKKQKDLPLALKDGLQDRVSQGAIRFNGTASSLWPPESSSQLDLTDKNVVCGYIRKGHIGISIWSLTLCDPPSHSDPIQQWEQLRWQNIISSCAQLASNMWHLPLWSSFKCQQCGPNMSNMRKWLRNTFVSSIFSLHWQRSSFHLDLTVNNVISQPHEKRFEFNTFVLSTTAESSELASIFPFEEPPPILYWWMWVTLLSPAETSEHNKDASQQTINL